MAEGTKRGGARPGAGRKSGTGPYGESTQAIRIPISQVAATQIFLEQYRVLKKVDSLSAMPPVSFPFIGSAQPLPLYASRVRAGFPSPADDYLERHLDLNEHLIRHPEATFFLRVQGDSMVGEGIHDGDLLIVDRAEKPAHGMIVVAAVYGELTVKKLSVRQGQVALVAAHPDYPPIQIREDTGFEIWGVVTNVIHKV